MLLLLFHAVLQVLIKIPNSITTLHSFLVEIDSLQASRTAGCQHVIGWRGVVFSTRGRMGFAMPKAPYTISTLPTTFSPRLLQRLGFHLLLGLYELQTIGYVHRDVKPGNAVAWFLWPCGVPFTENAIWVQLIDCGVGKRLAQHQTSI
jgi:serine/threonine protein kinase